MSDPLTSAYVMLGLAEAVDYGTEVDATVVDNGKNYLLAQLTSLDDNKTLPLQALHNRQAFFLYVLTRHSNYQTNLTDQLYDQRVYLSLYARAFLAQTIWQQNNNDERLNTLRSDLAQAAILSASGADWEETSPDTWNWNTDTRTTAIVLNALIIIDPKSELVSQGVRWLMHHRQNGSWETTQENAWALVALATYAVQVETGTRQFGGSLNYGGVSAAFHLDDNTQMLETTRAIIPVSQDRPEPQSLQLSNPEKASVFTMVQLEGRPRVGKQPRQDRGYSIQRSYAIINDDGTPAETGDWHVGDRVLITLRIEVRQPAHYLAVDDPLPAVFEAVNPAFKTQAMDTGANAERDCFSDYREIRNDRAVFFGDHVRPGNYTIRYLARVCAAGKVTAPAAKIEAMYHPERFGMSATDEVTSHSFK